MDYKGLFIQAVSTMMEQNGGSLWQALEDLGIDWDSDEGKQIRDDFDWEDEDELDLPDKLEIDRPDIDGFDEMEEYINDYLSDEYGFCTNSFKFDFDTKKVYIYEIEWDTTE
jgi:hypothetical protein